jgi:hypothetical protein
MAVIDRDRGYRRFLRNFSGIGTKQVLVGVRSKEGALVPEGGDLNLAEIAAVNEFGSDDGHVPERSYLRSTMLEKESEYVDEVGKIVLAAIQGRQSVDQGLGRLGLRAVRDVQATMRDLDTPPNAPSTIARKGADNPLIDTGRLRQSIDFEIRRVK